MSKVSSPAALLAAVAAFVLSGGGAFLPTGSAHADSACLAAPNGAAPQGEHWYYHFERQAGRKCWYLHASVRLLRRATPRPHSRPAPVEAAIPDPLVEVPPVPASTVTAPAGVSTPAGQIQTATADPHITILAVKTVPEPGATVPVQEPAPQPAPVAADAPVRQSQTADATVDAQSTAVADGAAPKAESAVKQNVPPQTASGSSVPRRAEMYFLVAIGLGILTFLIAVASRIIAMRRPPIISDYPDIAWDDRFDPAPIGAPAWRHERYGERDIPFIDPQEHLGLADLQHHGRIDQRPARRRAATRSEQVDLAPAGPSASSLTDIEPALRVLRQARKSRMA